MAKQKISAGVELDFVTPDELQGALDPLLKSLGQGVKFRRIINNYPATAGVLAPSPAGFGPDPGFLWDVRSIKTDMSTATTPGNTLIYLNDSSSGVNLLAQIANGAGVGPNFFNKQIIVHPGELLVPVLGAGVVQGPAQSLGISVAVIEVPIFHEGQLLL